MMRTLILSILLLCSAAFGSYAYPAVIHAQNTQDNAVDTNGNTGAINDTNTGTADRGFNWLWLLPLLAIPVLYFVMRDTRDTTTYDDRYLAGTKGGHVRRDDDDIVENEEEEVA